MSDEVCFNCCCDAKVPGEECCPGPCPEQNTVCCQPELCCGRNGEEPVCCEEGEECCGPAGERFCCPVGEKCCDDEYCCPEADTCCGGECCPEGRACCEGVCCDEGECCVDGVCGPCECESDEDCGEGQCCVDGVCGPCPCEEGEDCEEGECCVDGVCGECECEEDEDCPEGECCVDGECAPCPCATDADCEDFVECIARVTGFSEECAVPEGWSLIDVAGTPTLSKSFGLSANALCEEAIAAAEALAEACGGFGGGIALDRYCCNNECLTAVEDTIDPRPCPDDPP